jgi:antitoxin component of MazEF toxin-antitoxin module
MHKLRIQKIGESLGIILPNEILAHLNCGEGEMIVAVQGPSGKISMSHEDSSHVKIMAKAADLMTRYEGTLQDLAK